MFVYAFAMRLFAFYLQYCENKLNYLNHLIILYLKLLLIFLLDSNNNSPNVMVHRWIYFQQIHISFPTFQMLLHSLSRNWFTIALIDDFTTALQCSTLIQSFLLTTSPPPPLPPPANASPRYVICPSRKNNLQNSPSSPLDTPPTAFVCIFFSILKHSWVYQKNTIIKGWKYRSIQLLKAELFCHKKQ